MDLQEKIDRVDQDLGKGLKKKAINRLHGLIKTYPNELAFRSKLGHIYLDIGFMDSAGKYFILEKDRTDVMEKAVAIYMDSVSQSGWQILRDIQFEGDTESLNEYARNAVREFERLSKRETGRVPTYRSRRIGVPSIKRKWTFDFGSFLIVGALISVAVLALIGFFTVIKWIF